MFKFLTAIRWFVMLLAALASIPLPAANAQAISRKWATPLSSDGNDSAADIVRSGNYVYVVGQAYRVSNFTRIAVWKLDTNGNVVWQRTYPDDGSGLYAAKAAVVDSNGNVFVAAEGPGAHGLDYYVLKYEDDGDLDTGWGGGDGIVTFDGGVADDRPAKMIISSDGTEVIVTGSSKGTHNQVTSWDYLTIGYYTADPGNVSLAAQRYDNGADTNNGGNDFAVDLIEGPPTGADTPLFGVIVTGTSFDATSGNDYYTIHYGANGPQSDARWDNGANGDDQAAAIAIGNISAGGDIQGQIVVTGTSEYPSMLDVPGGTDYLTVCYSFSVDESNLAWTKRYDGTASGNASDTAKDVGIFRWVGTSQYAYVTGVSPGSTGGMNIVTIRYDLIYGDVCGDIDIYNSGGSDGGNAIVVDSSERPSTAGFAQGQSGTTDVYARRLEAAAFCGDPTPSELSDAYGNSGTSDQGVAVITDNTNVWVAGKVYVNATRGYDIVVTKYGP